MGKRTRTDLCGGGQRWSSLPRQVGSTRIGQRYFYDNPHIGKLDIKWRAPKPGSVSRMSYDPQVSVHLNDMDLGHGSGMLPGGIYFIRRGSTGSNKVRPTGRSTS
jgi:hypothetical protein